ncbi:unnamed protein product [Cuscuta epithymum]|uniref:Uncharacterized protein n=1 Tax=Cuscuta epithymum TaxID=186058 RepID=A0AAV0DZ94_9ASTE|nr:unnamed protein product [Cuscuta epithymum]
MGNLLSCKPGAESTNPPPAKDSPAPEPFDISADFRSYLSACETDPEFRAFDSKLQDRTTRAIHSVAVNLDRRTLSLDSLREVTACFHDMNHQVVNFILESKRDVWKDPDLLDLVKEYLDNSRHVMNFCTALESCLHRVHYSHSILKFALQKFEEETAQIRDPGADPTRIYSKTLEQLKLFKDAGSPFTDKFFSLFRVIYEKQESMLKKLKEKKRRLDKKLRRRKCWRRISNAIFATIFVSAIICSIVAAAVTAPPVVAALAAASSVPLGSVGKWINNLWKKYEIEVKRERDMVGEMEAWSEYVVIQDLQNINALVDKFEIEIEGLLFTADFTMMQTDGIGVAMEDIRKNVDGFMETAGLLNVHADECRKHIRMARAVILQKINEQPSGSSGGSSGSSLFFG